MNSLIRKIFKRDVTTSAGSRSITLSDFFPKNTVYFYGYPTGNEHNFLNSVPPYIEELVAARSNICSGENVSTVNFFSTTKHAIPQNVWNSLHITDIKGNNSLIFPKEISANVNNSLRNEKVRDFLIQNVNSKQLVMAQPFNDDIFASICQINPNVTTWLNDKANLPSLIPQEYLPKRYLLLKNGRELRANESKILLPVVIKVTSSSAGDGVYICRKKHELYDAINKLYDFNNQISVEELIESTKNYGIQFGMSYDGKLNIILGVSEQITSKEGEFIGGIVKKDIPDHLDEIINIIKYSMCTKVHKMGWYGVGCIDVLVTDSGRSYVIDPNFRMTGMSAAIMNSDKKSELMSFIMSFEKSEDLLIKALKPFIANNQGKVVAINNFEGKWFINFILYYEDNVKLLNYIEKLHKMGFASELFNKFMHKEF